MLITNHGQIIRMRVADISIIGRNTQGVRLMTMADEELVVGVARVVSEDDEDEETRSGRELDRRTLKPSRRTRRRAGGGRRGRLRGV